MNRKLIIHHSSFIIRKSVGFTLIELLVAISIIGILASFLLANFVGIRQRARDGTRKSDLRQIQSALELYRSDKGEYPTTAQFPATCGCALTSGGVDCGTSPSGTIYMRKIPCDPSTFAAYSYSGTGVLGTGSSSYNLIACLENVQDSQKDASNNSYCDGESNWSYTLQSP